MNFQVIQTTKRSIASIALIRFFASVNTLMLFQSWRIDEGLFASATLKGFFRYFSSVNLFMWSQRICSIKTSFTCFALEFLFIWMNSFMPFQSSCCVFKRCQTIFTFIGPFTRMNNFMPFQISRLSKRCLTNLALKKGFSLVWGVGSIWIFLCDVK